MKKLLLLTTLLATSAMADIPSGHYVLDKIECTDGKVLKLGGKFMQYQVTLDVSEGEMKMTALAKSASWSPFKLDCAQTNVGKFSYVGETQYEGYLAMDTVECNAGAWETILKKQKFGVEEQGVFDYTVNGNKLTIKNDNTTKLYSCKKTNSIPVYYYTKK